MTFEEWKSLGLNSRVFRLWQQERLHAPFCVVRDNQGGWSLSATAGKIAVGRGELCKMNVAAVTLRLKGDG
jgi:hypothetical protein